MLRAQLGKRLSQFHTILSNQLARADAGMPNKKIIPRNTGPFKLHKLCSGYK
jgi:hypothetical protein